MEYILLAQLYDAIWLSSLDKKSKRQYKPFPLPFDRNKKETISKNNGIELSKAKILFEKARSGNLTFKQKD